MILEWLYRTTFEVSLLIGLVLLIRPAVRRLLGARVAYWLWCVPMIRAVLPDRPERPRILVETLGSGTGGFEAFPTSPLAAATGGIPWEFVWLAGAFAWLVFKLVAWFRFRAALEASAEPLVVPDSIDASASRAAIVHRVRFVASDLPGTPFATGLVRPRICLPPDFAERFTLEERAWMVRHELMHVARRDLWVQFAWEWLRAAFWFNPLVHLAARALRDDQELACDQAIVSRCDTGARYSYGKTLIASTGAVAHPVSVPFFGNHRERIAMIARHRASKMRAGIGILLCVALGACALTSPPPVSVDTDQRITLKMVDLPLRNLLTLLAEFSGSNIVISADVPDINVTMSADNAPWDEVLEQVASCVGAELDLSTTNLILIGPVADGDVVGNCGDIEISG